MAHERNYESEDIYILNNNWALSKIFLIQTLVNGRLGSFIYDKTLKIMSLLL